MRRWQWVSVLDWSNFSWLVSSLVKELLLQLVSQLHRWNYRLSLGGSIRSFLADLYLIHQPTHRCDTRFRLLHYVSIGFTSACWFNFGRRSFSFTIASVDSISIATFLICFRWIGACFCGHRFFVFVLILFVRLLRGWNFGFPWWRCFHLLANFWFSFRWRWLLIDFWLRFLLEILQKIRTV